MIYMESKDPQPKQHNESKPKGFFLLKPLRSKFLKKSTKVKPILTNSSSRKIIQKALDKKKNKNNKTLRVIYITFTVLITVSITLITLMVISLAIVSSVYLKGLPKVTVPLLRNHSENTLIYSRNGTLIDTIYGNQNREYVKYNQISPYMIKAMISAEDVHFFSENLGIDPVGILRALYDDLFHSQAGIQGGSTITQQLVKLTALSDTQSLRRKVRGLFLTLEVSSQYSKKQILQAYLNDISFGGDVYGIQMAAETYFGIPAKDLNVAQSSLLAGIVQAPGVYSPLYGTHPELAFQRQHYVLNQMLVHQNIVQIPVSSIKTAENTKLTFNTTLNNLVAPWFIYYTRAYLDSMYGTKKVDEGGFRVYTTLSLKLQNIAQNAVTSGVNTLINQGYNTHNSSLVALNPKNGHVLAMVGSVNYNANTTYVKGAVNSTLSLVSPGSSLKPFVYITAFEKKLLTPNSIVYDTPLDIGGWQPTDWNGTYMGAITVATALLQSRNIPAIRTAELVSLQSVFQTFRSVGLSEFTNQSINHCGYTAVIGGCDITTLEEAQAYDTLANYGTFYKASPIDKIYNKYNKLVYNDTNPKGTKVFSKLYTEMVISIIKHYYTMAPVIDQGYQVAGKTGTSNNHIDNIFAGFSPNLTAVVWSGNDNYSFTSNNTWGETTAAPIWNNFMIQALKYYKKTNFDLSLWNYNYYSGTFL